jgi:uncharacterized protein YqeY
METLRADQLAARKSANTATASLLTTLIGEAAAIGKNAGNRETTDAEVVATVQKFLKNNATIIELGVEKLGEVAFNTATNEKQILEGYMPKKLSQMQIMAEIAEVKCTVADVKKLKGAVMAHFKNKFAGQYDSADVLAMIDVG